VSSLQLFGCGADANCRLKHKSSNYIIARPPHLTAGWSRKFCAAREFDHKLGRAGQNEKNWSGVATFCIVAHALGNSMLTAQWLAKSTLDETYKQFMHIGLWTT